MDYLTISIPFYRVEHSRPKKYKLLTQDTIQRPGLELMKSGQISRKQGYLRLRDRMFKGKISRPVFGQKLSNFSCKEPNILDFSGQAEN